MLTTIPRRAVLCVCATTCFVMASLSACGGDDPESSEPLPRLIYEEVSDGHVNRIVQVAADGSHRTVLWEGDASFQGPPSVAVDGRIVFPSDQGWFLLPAAGGTATGLPTVTDANAVWPHWSPDGTTIAWFALSPAGRSAIGLAAPSAGSIGFLTPDSLDAYLLDWSPDAQQLVFMAQNINTNSYNLYVMSRTGSGLRKITDDSLYVATQPTWSHSGGHIAFTNGNIMTVLPDGSGLRVITSGGAGNGLSFNEAPYWSPDDREFMSSTTPNHQIYRINAATGATTPIGIPFPASDPWSPDGRYVHSDSFLPPSDVRPGPTASVRVALADGTGGIQVSPDSVPSINAVWLPSTN